MKFEALQVEAEITRFAEIVRDEGVTSYLEIGAKFGGSLWTVATALPHGSTVVAVDLPRGTRAWPQSEKSLRTCASELKKLGYHVELIWGDSTHLDVVEQVRRLGPFDCTLLDGNHTLPYLEKDFANYSTMTRLMAFHDIAWRRSPDWREGIRIDVGTWWEANKGRYRYEEIKLCPTGKNNGIGVLWLS